MTASLPYRHALRIARRMGLVRADTTVIDQAWWPLWWALSEIGWLDESLLAALDTAAHRLERGSTDQRVRSVVAAGWLTTDRGAGRPARALVVTHQGHIDLPPLAQHAPAWTASTLEVTRRALAEVLCTQTAPFGASAAAKRVIDLAARWGRLVRERDVRQIILHWCYAGLIRPDVVARQRWLITPLGRRSLRAVARAVNVRLPRRPRLQDEDHDLQLVRLVEQLVLSHPGIVGTLRLARRAWLDPTNTRPNRRWIVPDGLVGFHTNTGPLLLAIEVERRGRYDNLARHAHNYGQLAAKRPHHRLRILVVTTRASTQRQLTLSDALAEQTADRHLNIAATITTPRTIGGHLAAWDIHPWTPAFAPPE